MPEFNFAKGGKSGDSGSTPTGAHQFQETGPQRPVSSHDADSDLPIELTETTPARPSATPRPATPAGDRGAAAPPRASGGSVLDRFPEHDLSHLEALAAGAAPEATPPPPPAAPPENTPAEEPAAAAPAKDKEDKKRSSWPLIAIGTIVGLLVLVAFIWHVNPWPPLRESIESLFRKPAPVAVKSAPAPVVDDVAASPERLWDYYLQVSSWKELPKADADAERYRAEGLPVVVESEAVRRSAGTVFRVRLGPYDSPDAAYADATAHPGLIPSDAFIDSVLIDPATGSKAKSSPPKSAAPAKPASADRVPTAKGDNPDGEWKEFDVVRQPLSGYAVKVSSLKNLDIARIEARKLLEQGYPSFITRASVAGVPWYRVLVGPFSTKSDADKYTRLINVTYGNDAYTIDLSSDRW